MNSNVLFEEDGSFKAGSVLSEAGASLQVEHASGKRSKVKANQVILRFSEPAPAQLLPGAQAAAEEIDVDFLWECAPQDEFGFEDLAAEYFGAAPGAVQRVAVLLRLQGSPIHFQRRGRGRYRPMAAETVRLALAAVERRRQLELRIDAMAQSLVDGQLPEEIGRQAATLIVRPDKQSAEYRALERACERTHRSAQRLLLECGAFASAHDLHRGRFEAEYFPGGTAHRPLAPESIDVESLPRASAQAFSIDDSGTTEIDDALSVQPLADGGWRVGVHIACPALGLIPDTPLDQVARERMSTVYMPGDKVTMLPESAIRPFSLDEGQWRPVLSLYLDIDAQAQPVGTPLTCVEQIQVAANLRHDRLDGAVTEEGLALAQQAPEAPEVLRPWWEALRVLWQLTLVLCAGREQVRGKPEPRFRSDFSFQVENGVVSITQRRRDAPLDRIVAEMMILANSAWGRFLADHGTPGVYRSQQAGRVRMTTHPLPHVGLGVAQYLWATSPLRRYVDLTNQRQLVAVARGERAPHAPNDANLFAIISGFDARYDAYGDFQTRMERYWCLRWLAQQEGVTRFEAVVVREDLVRLAQAPLYFRLADLPELAAGRRILVDVLERDEIDLSVSGRFAGLAVEAASDELAVADAAAESAESDGTGEAA